MLMYWFICLSFVFVFFFFKQKTAYEMRISDWSSDVCSSDLDLARFRPGAAERARFDLPEDRPIVLMVSAFIATKRVLDGIRAVAQLEDAYLVVAGDGPLRGDGEALAAELLPGRVRRLSLAAAGLPALHRSAAVFRSEERLGGKEG